MSVKSLVAIGAVAALSLTAMAASMAARAQTTPSVQPYAPVPPRGRARIEVVPRPLLYRHCVDWYELQHRPSGTVLYPQMHCCWVRG